jgi:transposase-like protein
MKEIEKQEFNFNDAVQDLLAGKNINGKDGVLAPLVKQLVEAALEAELDSHITQDVFSGNKNRKNGKTSKTIKSTNGTFELNTPRDRTGSFEPQLVKKNQTTISNEIEEKILSMYGLGLSYKDIIKHIEEIYQIELSTATISAITDKIIDKVKAWQSRPLESIYPFVWLDVIHYKIKDGGKYVTKAVYTVLGMGIDGKKDILGLYLSQSEGANFWLSVLTDLNNRGLEDILIASVDGLKGFPEAIKTIFPQTEVQLCVVHPVLALSLRNKKFIKVCCFKRSKRIYERFKTCLSSNNKRISRR